MASGMIPSALAQLKGQISSETYRHLEMELQARGVATVSDHAHDRAFAILDELGGEALAKKYLDHKNAERQRQIADNKLWQDQTQLELSGLISQMKSGSLSTRPITSGRQRYDELHSKIIDLCTEWNTIKGPVCSRCRRIQKLSCDLTAGHYFISIHGWSPMTGWNCPAKE
ncbi:MAG: hypothetical protein Q8P67_18475 [archaeon]|nr:hypothetical protein [archaeon]